MLHLHPQQDIAFFDGVQVTHAFEYMPPPLGPLSFTSLYLTTILSLRSPVPSPPFMQSERGAGEPPCLRLRCRSGVVSKSVKRECVSVSGMSVKMSLDEKHDYCAEHKLFQQYEVVPSSVCFFLASSW